MKMIDIKLIRENPELVKENIKKKFQDQKLVLVDEVVALDKELRAAKLEADTLRGKRNSVSKSIGMLMAQKKIEEANAAKKEVVEINERLEFLEKEEVRLEKEVKDRMMVIPNIIDKSVPIGKDDSENVEVARFGEAKVPNFDIPYHAEVMERLNGLDKDAS